MPLHEYLHQFRKGLHKFEDYGYADSIEIKEEVRANKQAVIQAKVVLINNSIFYIKEYIDAKYGINRVSYAYQYQNENNHLIFRYDNATHKPALNFKEHKHTGDGKVEEAELPKISELVDEIIRHL